ncbi:hypothetical protein C2E23DRAFT_801714 [Lenzites betulinus]|nr:hypothetical protein C2E23DRAFT_801714 [Lenzites betulinus]
MTVQAVNLCKENIASRGGSRSNIDCEVAAAVPSMFGDMLNSTLSNCLSLHSKADEVDLRTSDFCPSCINLRRRGHVLRVQGDSSVSDVLSTAENESCQDQPFAISLNDLVRYLTNFRALKISTDVEDALTLTHYSTYGNLGTFECGRTLVVRLNSFYRDAHSRSTATDVEKLPEARIHNSGTTFPGCKRARASHLRARSPCPDASQANPR